jgi:hypothetical protein
MRELRHSRVIITALAAASLSVTRVTSAVAENGARLRRCLVRCAVATLVITAGLGASPALAVQSAPSIASAHIIVTGTGIPGVDRANLTRALARIAPGGTISLRGRFRLSAACVLCLRVTKPVTIEGTGDPAVPNPDRRKVTIVEGGLSPIAIDQQQPGTIRITKIWFRGQLAGCVTARQSLTRLELVGNRATNITPLFIPLYGQLRFVFGSATVLLSDVPPAAAVSAAAEVPEIGRLDRRLQRLGAPGAANIPALERKFPGVSALFTGQGRRRLVGDLIISDNYVDLLHHPGRIPFLFGDDNVIGLTRGTAYSRILVAHNYLVSKGEEEIEGARGADARYTVVSNVIRERATPSIEGILVPPGGHPAALKMTGIQAGAVVVGNDIEVSGVPQGVAALFGSTDPNSAWRIERNRFGSRGQRVLFMGGYVAFPGAFPAAYLRNALVAGNVFAGNPRVGMWFDNLHWRLIAPNSGLINRANHVRIVRDDFSALTSSRAALLLGPSTHDNVFIGQPNGPVINQGTNNRIVITHRASP